MKKIILSDTHYSELIRLLAQVERSSKICNVLDCKDHCGELSTCPLDGLVTFIEKHTRTVVNIGEAD